MFDLAADLKHLWLKTATHENYDSCQNYTESNRQIFAIGKLVTHLIVRTLATDILSHSIQIGTYYIKNTNISRTRLPGELAQMYHPPVNDLTCVTSHVIITMSADVTHCRKYYY